MSKLKVYTSYFYQVRNFPTNMIPVSTAVWDPKWFHRGNGQDYIFRDKRGVYNGFRINPLVPDRSVEGLCHGPKDCSFSPTECAFMEKYGEQLSRLDFDDFIKKLESCVDSIIKLGYWDGEPMVALLFHEAPDNPCSEREVVQGWFRYNGYPIAEWMPDDKSDNGARHRNIVCVEDLPFR